MKKFTFLLLMVFISSSLLFGQAFTVEPVDIPTEYNQASIINKQLRTNIDLNNASRGAIILEETFDSDLDGWLLFTQSGSNFWAFGPDGSAILPPFSLADGGFAIADSYANSPATGDMYLYSPSMDLSALNGVLLDLDRDFQSTGTNEYAMIYMFSNNGVGLYSLEETLYQDFNSDPLGGTHVQFWFDPSGYNDPSDVVIMFRYYSPVADNYHYAFDNVLVTEYDASIVGHVANGDGLSIAGATVSIPSVATTTTDASGNYQLFDITDGTYDVTVSKDGYNSNTQSVNVAFPAITTQDFMLTSPNFTVSPLIFDETLHPNEYLTRYLGLLNTGDGPVDWTAAVTSGGAGGTEELIYDNSVASGGYYWIGSVMSTHMSPAGPCQILEMKYYVQWGAGDFNAVLFDWEGTEPGTIELFNETQTATNIGDWMSIDVSGDNILVDGDFVLGFGSTAGTLGIGFDSGLDNGRSWDYYGGVWSSYYEAYLIRAVVQYPDGTVAEIGGRTRGGDVVMAPNATLLEHPKDYSDVVTTDPSVRSERAAWLTLSDYAGTLVGGGASFNIGVNFDAAGTVSGEVYEATINLTTDPNVGEINVPVTMTIGGDEFPVIEDLTATLDPVTGQVDLAWGASREVTLDYYAISRNGVPLTTTMDDFYTDMLPDFGTYSYTVQPIFLEGVGAIAGPVEVEWYQPELAWSPDPVYNAQWPNTEEEVSLTLSNIGSGVLEFTFPEWAAMTLLNDPNIEKNDISPIDAGRSTGDENKGTFNGSNGHPVILGAGGPDAYGYVWIDSEEAGGPVYNWIDISGTGTEITGVADDNIVGPFDIGWDFPYYGEAKTEFWVNSNGSIGFTSTYIGYGNAQIPGTNGYGYDFVAWFWDDLYGTTANVYYQDMGDMLIVQFNDYEDFSGTGTIDAQVIFYPSGEIVIQYASNTITGTGYTVGLQSSNSAVGLGVSYNTDYVQDELALWFGMPDSFITSVEPFWGLIGDGEDMDITLTYSSHPVVGLDYSEPGSYLDDLAVMTNEVVGGGGSMIPCEMFVYEPAMLTGQVTDCFSGDPIENVTIQAYGPSYYLTVTANDGTYEMYVDPGTYDIRARKVGYQGDWAYNVDAMVGDPGMADFSLCEEPYPVDWVLADPNDADDTCFVSWSVPMGPYLIAYDDGSAEDYFAWAEAGGMAAVKFTPAGYPATVEGARMYVGDGSFPEGGDFWGNEISVMVFDDDGPGGMPGTMLDSSGRTVNRSWVVLNDFKAEITEGDFYIVYEQLYDLLEAAPIGVDNDVPTSYRSYVKGQDSDWMVSTYQDMMIRAIVSGPNGNVVSSTDGQMVYPAKPVGLDYVATSSSSVVPGVQKSGNFTPVLVEDAEREFTNYFVWRVNNFDPDAGETPADGDLTTMNPNTTAQSFADASWEDLDPGFYAYAVQAIYDDGEEGSRDAYGSDTIYSNIVAHLLDNEVTVEVTQCDGLSAEGAEVSLTGDNFPYQEWEGVIDATGMIVFDSVIDGYYDLVVTKLGYQDYMVDNMFITNDMTITVVLEENAYPAENLMVDPLTSIATWDPYMFVALDEETFEGPFPPAGWLLDSDGEGWFKSDDASSEFVEFPEGDGFYAATNDDGAGETNDASMDYLVTSVMDLQLGGEYFLYFDYYFEGTFGGTATVEYTLDGAETWTVLETLPSSGAAWATHEISLAALAGEAAVWIGFHYDDGGLWADGMGIDNVSVRNGYAEPLGWNVYLDDGFVGSTAADVLTWTYTDLEYGQEYTASVKAVYSCGLSEAIYYTWNSTYLYPPRFLDDEYLYGTNEVPLTWNPPVMVVAPPVSRETVIQSVAASTMAESTSGMPRIVNGDRAMWDILYGFDADGASGEVGLAGAGCDGTYTYATLWAGNGIVKFDAAGNYIETFSIPGVSGLRDLAFDGTYFYGSANTTTIWIMDFTNKTLEGTITSPINVRAIAYDDTDGALWVNNWGAGTPEPLKKIDMDGNELESYATPPSMYGMAYDQYTAGGPYLWFFTGTGAAGDICQVEQFDIATFTLTGVMQSVSDDFGPTIAGGLYLNEYIVPGKITLGGIAQGEPDIAFGYDIGDFTGGGAMVPDGLLSFNLYRDDAMIANIPWDSEEGTVNDVITYIDNNLNPACYAYEVTALYDLSVFGFAGEIGESMAEGPHEVCVVWGFDLPFCEDFSQGTFEFNGWMASGDNWKINSDVGNPEPSAEFSWDPQLFDYESMLVSPPMDADMLSEGDLWMDFDVALDDRNSTGMEMLTIEVFDGMMWNEVASFANDGSFEFMSSHINISEHVMGQAFNVRFVATGDDSFDIVAWYVDNVCFYRTCDAPTNLTGEYVYTAADDFGAEVCWEANGGAATGTWMTYNDGTFENGFCSSAGGAGLAQLFTPTEYPVTITEVRYFNDAYGSPELENHIYVLSGDGATVLAGPYPVSGEAGDTWVTVDVDDVTLTEGTFMVYTENQLPDGPFVGVDDSFYDGSLYFGAIGDFAELGSLGDFAYVGSHEAYVSYGEAAAGSVQNSVLLAPGVGEQQFEIAVSNHSSGVNVMKPANRELTHFNVYRSTDGAMGTYELLGTVDAEAGVSEYCYFDASEIGEYCYKVTAVYMSDTDECESDYAMDTEEEYDYVCVLITDVENPDALTTNLYPNPTRDQVTITASAEMTRLTVINYVGQVVMDSEMNQSKYVLNTSNFESGVYVVRIETESEVITKRFAVAR